MIEHRLFNLPLTASSSGCAQAECMFDGLSLGQERRIETRLYTFGSDVHITSQSTDLGSFDLLVGICDALAMTLSMTTIGDRRGEIGLYYYVYTVRCSVGGPLRFVLH